MRGAHPLTPETDVRGRRATIWWVVSPYVWLVLPAFAAWRLWSGFGPQSVGWLARTHSGTILIGIIAIAQIVILWRVMHVRRELRSGDRRFCLYCGHSLVGLESPGTCPECGRSYETAAVRSAWRSLAGPFYGENRP